MEEPHLKTHRHIKIAQILIIVAIGLNLVMLVFIYGMMSEIGGVKSRVNSLDINLQNLNLQSSQSFQKISKNITSLNTDLVQSAQSIDLVNALLRQLGERIIEVQNESQTGLQSIRSEINYTGVINEAMDAVVLIIWTDKESIVGSGFFVSQDGYIVTANHVITDFNGKTIRVKTKDGDLFTATVVKKDEDADVAVLKISVTNATYLEFGDSETLVPGSKVFALGAPEGFAFSASEGIVSAVRSVEEIKDEVGVDLDLGETVHVVQTDASITHGNSGGPLIDKTGKAVGLNSFGISRSSGKYSQDIAGLNFAISSNDVKLVYEAAI